MLKGKNNNYKKRSSRKFNIKKILNFKYKKSKKSRWLIFYKKINNKLLSKN